MSTTHMPPPRGWDLLGLAGWLVLCFVMAGIGSMGMSMGLGPWYAALDRPAWAPPDWVFGPVWSVLYLLMGVAAWLVWRARGFEGAGLALGLFLVQLTLNALWPFIFFAAGLLWLAAAEILLLWLAILATLIAFWRVRVWAGVLLIPYLAWVSYATALNVAIAWMN